jgi:hypothetical protein
MKRSIDYRQCKTAAFAHAVRGQIDSPTTRLALDWFFRGAVGSVHPWCPESHRRGSGGFTVVVIQEAAEP